MIVWINGPYGVGKSTLAEKLLEKDPHGFIFDAEIAGNAVRDNLPKELFRGYLFENYPLWFEMCTALLTDISRHYDGTVYVPMTLALPDSFEKIARPLGRRGISVRHILLESSYDTIHDRILARGEEEDCWCMKHIRFCLENQKKFDSVIRIRSVGASPDDLAAQVQRLLKTGRPYPGGDHRQESGEECPCQP